MGRADCHALEIPPGTGGLALAVRGDLDTRCIINSCDPHGDPDQRPAAVLGIAKTYHFDVCGAKDDLKGPRTLRSHYFYRRVTRW